MTELSNKLYWEGQSVIWLHTPRAGYGFTVKILATVAKTPKPGAKAIRIRLSNGELRTVRRDRLRVDL